MSLTLYQRAQAGEDSILRDRTRQALLKYALYISANPATPDNDLRLVKQVLAAPDTFAALFALGVAQNDFAGDGTSNDPLPNTTAGDTALSSVVEATLWPAFAMEIT